MVNPGGLTVTGVHCSQRTLNEVVRSRVMIDDSDVADSQCQCLQYLMLVSKFPTDSRIKAVADPAAHINEVTVW